MVAAGTTVAAEMDSQGETYTDIADLGRGGMGDVYLAVGSNPADSSKLFVVKRLRSALASDPDFLQMFLDEARTAANLEHANIAETYEVGFDGEHYFIAREYLEGQSLAELGRRAAATGGLPLAMQLRVLADALAGLHHAHEQRDADGDDLQIVHRDFSPSNIFVLCDGRVKIVDFGIAKTAYGGRTKADIFKGKIQYVAPEQYASKPLDRRTDIYSAGVVLWEAATQRRMWNGSGELGVMQRVAAGDIPLPSSIEPGIPRRLEAICMRALSLRPADRYPTAAMFQADIEGFLAELGEPFSAQDVGRFVAQISADVRANLKKVVEEQLRLLRDKLVPLSLTPTVSTRMATKTLWLGPPRSKALRRTQATLGLVASAVLGVLSGLIIVQWGHWPVARTETLGNGGPSQPSLPVLPITARPKPAVVSRTRLMVETIPAFARVGVDEALLPAGAHEVAMARDHATHRVWAEAPGYRSSVEQIRFDDDQVSLRLTLVPNQRPRPTRDLVREGPRAPAVAMARAGEGASAPADHVAAAPLVRAFDPSASRPGARPMLDATDPWKD